MTEITAQKWIAFPVEMTDEMAEAIALTANVCGGIAYDVWVKLMEEGTPLATPPAVTASPAPVVPDGWKLAPVEPTPEMMGAASQYESKCAVLNYGAAPDAEGLYGAMIDAAPPAPVAAPTAMQEEALTTCVTCQGFGTRAHPDDPCPIPCPDCFGAGAVSASPPAGEGREALIGALVTVQTLADNNKAWPNLHAAALEQISMHVAGALAAARTKEG